MTTETDADLLAHVYLRACRREILDALDAGRTSEAARAMTERDEFLERNPQYDDGTYRAVG